MENTVAEHLTTQEPCSQDTVVNDVSFFIRADAVHHMTQFSHLCRCQYHIWSQKYSVVTFHATAPRHTHFLAGTHHNVYSPKLKPVIVIKQSTPSCNALKWQRFDKHNQQICITDYHCIYSGVDGNMHDM
jgi:hypothetical protein